MCALATAAVGGAWLILVPSWPYAPVMAAAAALLALAFMAVGGKKNKTQVSRPLSFTERVEILASKQGLDEEGKVRTYPGTETGGGPPAVPRNPSAGVCRVGRCAADVLNFRGLPPAP